MAMAGRAYTILADGEPIFTGSYKGALMVYESFERYHEFVPDDVHFPVLTINFVPVKKGVKNGSKNEASSH